MAAYTRDEMERMVEHWLAVNREAEATGDWRRLADCYTEDATYGWNCGPEWEFMAVGRDQIRDWAVGVEMGGLGGWTYPYMTTVVDERRAMVVGFWRQLAQSRRADGTQYEVAGIGGSWFGYGGNMQWAWQRDWFDFGNATATFLEMLKDGSLSDGMKKRLETPLGKGPGQYRLGTAPAPLWPPNVRGA